MSAHEPAIPGAFLALADVADAMVFITEPTGRMLWCNDDFRRRTGFGPEDFQFENHDNPFIHREDLPRVGAFLAEFAGSDERLSGVLHNRFVDRWGRVSHVRSRVAKLSREQGPAFLVLCREAEPPDGSSSVDTEQSYRSLVEQSEELIVKLDAQGRLLFANARLREFSGLSLIELGKGTLVGLLHPDDRAAAARALALAHAEGGRHPLDVRLVHVCGSQRRLQGLVVRYSLADGDAVLQASLRDVTESCRLQERIQQTQRLESLGLLAGGIAHDFNNLLTGILANATVAAECVDGADVRERLDAVVKAASRASELTREMLAYAGRAPMERVEVDLNALIRDLPALVGAALSRRVRLAIRPCAGELRVSGSPAQLVQVVINLVTNAAEASRESGTVEIEAGTAAREPLAAALELGERPPAPRCWIEVRDVGHGMDPETTRRIFDPFFTTKEHGRGLGLSAVLGIVGQHRGAVSIQSSPDRGTLVRVELPLATTTAATVAAAPPTASHDARPPVLIVDDEALVLNIARRIVERAGYPVVAVDSGEAAIRALESSPGFFGLVLLDHTMPEMDGPEVRRRLQALQPGLPVVMMSGWKATTDEPGALSVDKPFTPKHLLAAIASALDQVG